MVYTISESEQNAIEALASLWNQNDFDEDDDDEIPPSGRVAQQYQPQQQQQPSIELQPSEPVAGMSSENIKKKSELKARAPLKGHYLQRQIKPYNPHVKCFRADSIYNTPKKELHPFLIERPSIRNPENDEEYFAIGKRVRVCMCMCVYISSKSLKKM